jgi:hypothetical protein
MQRPDNTGPAADDEGASRLMSLIGVVRLPVFAAAIGMAVDATAQPKEDEG